MSEGYTPIPNDQRPGLRQQPGDYLYFWGNMRILSDSVPDLPAPGNSWLQPVQTAAAPPPASEPGNPCLAGSADPTL